MLKSVIGQAEAVKELGRIAKMWQDPQNYEKLFSQKIPKRILIVGEDDYDRKEVADRFIEEVGRVTYYPQEEDRKVNDFQGWVKHTTAYAFSAALQDRAVSVAVLEDVDCVMESTAKDQPRMPAEALEFEVSALADSLACVVMTAVSDLPLKELIDKGFFDRIIRLAPRSSRDNEAVFKNHLCDRPVANLDFPVIASLLVGKPISTLENAMRIASEISFARGDTIVTTHDLVDACLEILYDARELPATEKGVIPYAAYHEAGHAVIAEVLRPYSVAVASIKTYHSGIAGVTCLTYPDEWDHLDRDQMARVAVLLAGKAAVYVACREVDVGATKDVAIARRIMQRRVARYESRSFGTLFPKAKERVGETLSDELERRAREDLSTEYSKVLDFFYHDDVRACLEAVANALRSEHTLLGSEVREIMEAHPISPVSLLALDVKD